jgi:Mlc titration factor MtfA (ptsG expression regulator)
MRNTSISHPFFEYTFLLNKSMGIVLLLLGLAIIAVFFIVFLIVEPAYVLLYNKPLWVHGNLFPKPVTVEQRKILSQNFSFYNRLTPKNKRYFEHRINKFVSNYQFIGHEIDITDEVIILISGTYVMLTFGMRNYLSDLFRKILIYPTVYYSTLNEVYHKGEFNPRMKTIVFSWEDFLLGHGAATDNMNLGLHEFTHVLHFHCLKKRDVNASIFQDEYAEILNIYKTPNLIHEISEKAYFRVYAFENQFEFIAVLLEHFFETPQKFKSNHPQLYAHVTRMINYNETNFISS